MAGTVVMGGFDLIALAPVAVSPIIGSFIGVLIERLPESRSIALSRSRCDHCDAILGPLELLPLLSYAVQRGRCRHCGQPIGRFYPAVELASLAIAVSTVLVSPAEQVLWNCGFGWTLLALAWIDIRTGLLPDRLTLPLTAAGLAQAWLLDRDLAAALIGAVGGYGFVWLIEIAYRRLRGREGIGLGDAKLLAAAGAWLGWTSLPATVLTASVCALLAVGVQMLSGRAVDRYTSIAFGPFLALGMWVVRLFDPMGFLQ